MKERVSQEPQQPVQRIYNDVLNQAMARDPGNADALAASMPVFPSCRSSLQRTRKKNEPPLPKQRTDIDLPADCRVTTDGRTFLQADDGREDKILLFATDNSIMRACASQCVYMDGTFYTCPRLFYQLFTVHTEEQGKMFPLIFALLPDKSATTYERLFGLIKQRAQALGLDFSPPKVQTDFEQALLRAVRQSFPQARTLGCLFHYGQAIWRKIQALGGAVQYREENSVHSYFRRCAALTFIPLERQDEAWVQLQATAEDEPLIRDFNDYYVTTWFDDIDARFPRPLWNHYDNMSTESIRTNNALEAWHRSLKRIVGSAHPNVFKIVRDLIKENTRVETELRMLRMGQETRRAPRRAIRRRNERLERIKEQFLNGQKTLMQMLDACSYAIHI